MERPLDQAGADKALQAQLEQKERDAEKQRVKASSEYGDVVEAFSDNWATDKKAKNRIESLGAILDKGGESAQNLNKAIDVFAEEGSKSASVLKEAIRNLQNFKEFSSRQYSSFDEMKSAASDAEQVTIFQEGGQIYVNVLYFPESAVFKLNTQSGNLNKIAANSGEGSDKFMAQSLLAGKRAGLIAVFKPGSSNVYNDYADGWQAKDEPTVQAFAYLAENGSYTKGKEVYGDKSYVMDPDALSSERSYAAYKQRNTAGSTEFADVSEASTLSENADMQAIATISELFDNAGADDLYKELYSALNEGENVNQGLDIFLEKQVSRREIREEYKKVVKNYLSEKFNRELEEVVTSENEDAAVSKLKEIVAAMIASARQNEQADAA